MVRKMTGAITIRTRLTKVSPRGRSARPVEGQSTPTSTPSAMATSTRTVRLRPRRAMRERGTGCAAGRSSTSWCDPIDLGKEDWRRGSATKLTDQRKRRFDLSPVRLFPGGQPERLPEGLERLVHREPRQGRGYLEQHPARFTEVD